MTNATPVVLGSQVTDGLERAQHLVARDPAGAAQVVWPTFELGVFRLAGLAVSHWMAAGAPGFGEHPLPSGPLLALGSAEHLLTFALSKTPLFPVEKLQMPAVRRLGDTVEAVVSAIADVPAERLATPRFDLAAHVDGVGPSRKGMTLSGAVATFIRLRNLEAHHAGREQKWVAGHPDYHRLFAPLLVDAAVELFTHPDLSAPLRHWCVGTVVDASGPALAVEVDHPTLQRVYCEGTAIAGDPLVVDTRRGPSKATVAMLFIDLGGGVPNELSGESRPIRTARCL